MADMFRVEVKGIKELQAKFKQIDAEMQAMLSQATSAGAAVVVREAKINSGRGGTAKYSNLEGRGFPHRITGTLMRSIKEVRKTKSPTRCESQVGSTIEYAMRLEMGFMDTDSLGRRYHQQPRPFLRPALDENEAEIRKAFEEKIKKILGRHK
jgi:HK97 gp10 family phage protein